MYAGFEIMFLNDMCSSDPKGSFTFVSPLGNSIIDYFIVSADLLRNNIDMSLQSRIESWPMPDRLITPKCTKQNKTRELSALHLRQTQKQEQQTTQGYSCNI